MAPRQPLLFQLRFLSPVVQPHLRAPEQLDWPGLWLCRSGRRPHRRLRRSDRIWLRVQASLAAGGFARARTTR